MLIRLNVRWAGKTPLSIVSVSEERGKMLIDLGAGKNVTPKEEKPWKKPKGKKDK